jgi:hypothetical protein
LCVCGMSRCMCALMYFGDCARTFPLVPLTSLARSYVLTWQTLRKQASIVRVVRGIAAPLSMFHNKHRKIRARHRCVRGHVSQQVSLDVCAASLRAWACVTASIARCVRGITGRMLPCVTAIISRCVRGIAARMRMSNQRNRTALSAHKLSHIIFEKCIV